jgi:hypothetical protein
MRARGSDNSIDYVESPLDRIVNVNWGGALTRSLTIDWTAALVDPSDLYEPHSATVMTVSTTHLPLLSPATLSVGPSTISEPFSQEVFGSFPDGPDGTINGTYFLRQIFGTGAFTSFSTYDTNATRPFGGAAIIGISLAISLRPQDPLAGSASGHDWNATATFNTGTAELSEGLTGFAASGGSFTLIATATFGLTRPPRPPSLVFTS